MQPPAKKQRAAGPFRINFDASFNNLKRQLNNLEDTQFINGPKIDVRGYLWQLRLHKINKNVEIVLIYLGPHETCAALFELEFEPNLGFGKEVFEKYTYTLNKTSEYMCIFECDQAPDAMTVKVMMEIYEERDTGQISLAAPPTTSSSSSSSVVVNTVTPTASASGPTAPAPSTTLHSVSFAPSASVTSSSGTITTHLIPHPPPPITVSSSSSSASAAPTTTIKTIPTAHSSSSTTSSSTTSSSVSPKNEPILYRLYRERIFSDCSFLVGGETIHAHRFVLCFGSRVFHSMFSPDANANAGTTADSSNSSKHQQLHQIVVEGTSAEVFELLLKYLYTHQCESSVLLTQCSALLDVAAKYRVDGLVSLCVNHMISHQGIHTATDILLSAERNGLTSVKRAVISFIVANMKRMTQETDMLSRLDTKLKDEIIRSI